jgi:type IV secretory pathway VirB10-like protein
VEGAVKPLLAALAVGLALAACSGEPRGTEATPPPARQESAPTPEAGAPIPPAAEPAPTPATRPATPKPAPRPAPAESAAPAPEVAPGTQARPEPEPAPGTAREPLDLDGLAQRLQQSHAIGVFTKLKLKNEFDDLLEDLRALREGRSGATLADLRERYDLLLMKVIALLDGRDTELSHDLLASRDEIWTSLRQHATLAES